MQIEITSTLTQEDENRLAPSVLKLLTGILEMLPVAYMVRVETTGEQVLTQVNPQVWNASMLEPVTDSTLPMAES